MDMKPTQKYNAAFTLVELLVVIAILGLLASVLLVAVSQTRIKARDTRRLADISQVAKGLELYYDKNGQYPPLAVHPSWTGNWCDQTPSCLAQADQNWTAMINSLRSAGVLADFPEPQESWWEKLADAIPSAQAASLIQDPLYPTDRYEYMPSASPLNQNYRLRVKLEDPKAAGLKAAVAGKFFWSEDYKSTGPDSCDPSLGYYCSGPGGIYQAFDPGKPVIYLYPTHPEQVSVKVYPLSIEKSVPFYNQGWQVFAQPNGQLTNLFDHQTYPYLFWEGQSTQPKVDSSQGAVVADAQIEAFLMQALQQQGLTQSEAQDFVNYWAPRMHGQPYVYVYFMPQPDYDQLVPLQVSPKPDTVIRVYMLFKQLDAPVSVIPQHFTAPARKGFTVVEWGGDRSQIHE